MDSDNEITQLFVPGKTQPAFGNMTTRPIQAPLDDPFGYRAIYLQGQRANQRQGQDWQTIVLACAGGVGIALACVWFVTMKDEAAKLAWVLLGVGLVCLMVAAYPQIGKSAPAPA